MKILKDILKESFQYYQDIQKKIEKRLRALPRGSVKPRLIAGHKYYYLQERKDKKVVHKYISKLKPEKLIKQIKERQALSKELKQVKEALKILNRKRS